MRAPAISWKSASPGSRGELWSGCGPPHGHRPACTRRDHPADGPFATGSGPLVTGPTVALVTAMTGRAVCCDDLAGPGVELLRRRCRPA
ncbi:hypothetical protein [Streptomyces sp. NPDC058632]|uniref:hypothetical protein n=1 Tax=unclassified Streptomyces TaxID=2593676 RepID=UPI00365D8AB8